MSDSLDWWVDALHRSVCFLYEWLSQSECMIGFFSNKVDRTASCGFCCFCCYWAYGPVRRLGLQGYVACCHYWQWALFTFCCMPLCCGCCCCYVSVEPGEIWCLLLLLWACGLSVTAACVCLCRGPSSPHVRLLAVGLSCGVSMFINSNAAWLFGLCC